jgi:FAD/FMN-containing dehydrogenase
MNQTLSELKVSSWGNYPVIEGNVQTFGGKDSLPVQESWIPRGMGRSYGDSALAPLMISSRKMNRLLEFDDQSGILRCEAGVTFEDLLNVFVPRGWFPPVTPGTKFVSMGGALASDVHGKNHHKEGAFSRHVLSFDLMIPSGEVLHCSRTENPDIFMATAGGMGLTGMILNLSLKMKPIETSLIDMESVKAENLEAVLELFSDFEDATYSVAWLDCLAKGNRMGRSLVMKGEHATRDQIKGTRYEKDPLFIPKKLKLNVPFDFPAFVLNPLTTRAFNLLYYNKQFSKRKRSLVDYDAFFYPLDSIFNWNRIYGKRGFAQYQFVLPREAGIEGLKRMLSAVTSSGMASFLTVLKYLGKPEGMIAFPMEGYTVALDFSIHPKIFPFLKQLDAKVEEMGGRVYLTKDSRMDPGMLVRTYPGLEEFRGILKRLDPERKLRSLQAERLQLHG